MEDKQWGMQRLESLKKPKKIELYFSHKNSPKNYYKKKIIEKRVLLFNGNTYSKYSLFQIGN